MLVVALVVVVAVLVGGRALGPERYGIDVSAFPEGPAQETLLEEMADEAGGERPNVVIILADDLGYGDVGAYGGTVIDTPNIDALAADGMRFTEAYASAPICSPSRAGLLTGRYPLRSGIMSAMQMANDTLLRKTMHRVGIALSQLAVVDVPGGKNLVEGLPESEITLAEALGAAGYNTMAVGKWHLGDFTVLPEFHPFNHGFDQFVGFNGSNDDFPVAFWRGKEEVSENIGAEQEPYTRIFTEAATGFIREDRESPFLLYLAHKDPHLPFYPSEPFAGGSDGGAYGDAVEELDWSVGEVLRALEETGQRENTLVIFTSDNGPWFDGSPGNLRGRKGQTYEGGFRVPLIASWPGRIPAGETRHTPTMNFDLYATALDLAGVATPADRAVDGVSLWPVLSGGSETLGERPLFYFHDYDVEAMRRGPWKLVRSISHWTWPVPLDKPDTLVGGLAGARDYTPPGTDEVIPTLGTLPLLYRVDRDAGEAYDLKAHYAERVDEMMAEVEGWRRDFYDNPRGWKRVGND
jgi:arylsulfatase A-like enzyme